MRYGLDGRTIQDHFPGIGRYAYALARWLPRVAPDDDFVLFYDPKAPHTHHDLAALTSMRNLEMVPVGSGVFSVQQQWRLRSLARRHRLDLYHSPYYLMPYAMPCPVVVTIHDLIPEFYPHALPANRPAALFRLLVGLAARRAAMILVDSEATRVDISRCGIAPASRVGVVPLGVSETFARRSADRQDEVRSRYGLDRPYLLYVGINKPHKNLVRLVRAWASMPVEARQHHYLVIAGPKDARHGSLSRCIEDLGLGDTVRLVGRIAEEHLPSLYAGAVAFAFPSLYEGFGLPVLEAMACGTPVVCSSTPSVAEVAGDAALLFDPEHVSSIRDALLRVLTEPDVRVRLRQAGRTRAAHFSWECTASQTLAAYRRTLGGHVA